MSTSAERKAYCDGSDTADDRCLVKPIRTSELWTTIAEMLGDKAQQRTGLAVAGGDGASSATVLPRLRVLVAEDNPVNRRVAKHMLSKCGHDCEIVGNGREVIEALQSQSYDLILMDVQMPEMDGLEATRRIRLDEATSERHIPIIAMTAHAMKGDRDRCIDAGMDDYVAKPLQLVEVQRVLAGLAESQIKGTASESAAQASVFDVDLALQRMGGDEQLLNELTVIFREHLPERTDALRLAAAQADLSALAKAAHVLKSAVGNFAALPAFEALQELEQSARDGDDKKCAVALERAYAAVDSLVAALPEVTCDLQPT